MMACPPIDHVRLVRVVISLGRTDWELEASMLWDSKCFQMGDARRKTLCSMNLLQSCEEYDDQGDMMIQLFVYCYKNEDWW